METADHWNDQLNRDYAADDTTPAPKQPPSELRGVYDIADDSCPGRREDQPFAGTTVAPVEESIDLERTELRLMLRRGYGEHPLAPLSQVCQTKPKYSSID